MDETTGPTEYNITCIAVIGKTNKPEVSNKVEPTTESLVLSFVGAEVGHATENSIRILDVETCNRYPGSRCVCGPSALILGKAATENNTPELSGLVTPTVGDVNVRHELGVAKDASTCNNDPCHFRNLLTH